jgi:hypothetical protein
LWLMKHQIISTDAWGPEKAAIPLNGSSAFLFSSRARHTFFEEI